MTGVSRSDERDSVLAIKIEIETLRMPIPFIEIEKRGFENGNPFIEIERSRFENANTYNKTEIKT